MNEFDAKYDFGIKASLYEKQGKKFRSTPEMPKLKKADIETQTTLKGEKIKLKGSLWPQQ
jgi:hypothetical protein